LSQEQAESKESLDNDNQQNQVKPEVNPVEESPKETKQNDLVIRGSPQTQTKE